MKKVSILIVVFIFATAAQLCLAQSQKEKDRATFISNAKLLEKKPFDSNAAAAREWGFLWLVETDAVTVKLCSGMMKLIPEKKNKFKSELLMQFNFGMAVFKLENPDKKEDEVAAGLAGIESMLRTYEVMVKENEKAKNAGLDELLAKRDGGELKKLVEGANCGKK